VNTAIARPTQGSTTPRHTFGAILAGGLAGQFEAVRWVAGSARCPKHRAASYNNMGRRVISTRAVLDILGIQTLQELQVPQNTKDSNGGKTQPVKDTGANGSKHSSKGSADRKSASPAGSQNKGKQKTTP